MLKKLFIFVCFILFFVFFELTTSQKAFLVLLVLDFRLILSRLNFSQVTSILVFFFIVLIYLLFSMGFLKEYPYLESTIYELERYCEYGWDESEEIRYLLLIAFGLLLIWYQIIPQNEIIEYLEKMRAKYLPDQKSIVLLEFGIRIVLLIFSWVILEWYFLIDN